MKENPTICHLFDQSRNPIFNPYTLTAIGFDESDVDMSPALVDAGGASSSSSTPNCQVASAPCSVNSFGYFSVSQSKFSKEKK